MAKRMWLLVSAGLVLLGVALFALQPGSPDPECATDPNATSGFTDPGQDCPISMESMNAIRDYERSPKWFRIAGVSVAATGLVLAVVVGIARARGPSPDEP